MAMVVNHNIPALSTYNVINSTSSALQKSINKLSTGLRINSAADDAAGLAISEKMRAQVRGLDQAVSNSQDGISMIQTAEGALSETHSILQRMRELSVQAANDTLTQQDRGYIQEEVDQLREEITRIGNTTQFNKKKLLNGDAAVLWSSDDLETKAVVNGGLRTIDQFGQKSSAEGNYKISIKAVAGQGEVQKTDLMKIKHDIDFDVVGTSKFNGAALENKANVEGIGAGSFKLTVGDGTNNVAYEIQLQHDLKDSQGLADAINSAMELVDTSATSGTAATVNSLTGKGDILNSATITAGTGFGAAGNYVVKASVDDNGNLVLTSASGKDIAIDAPTATRTAADDLQQIFGATDENQLKAQTFDQTFTFGTIPTDLTGLASADYGFKVTTGGNDAAQVTISGDAFKTGGAYDGLSQSERNAALKAEIVKQLNDTGNANGLSAELSEDGNSILLHSEAGVAALVAKGTAAQDMLENILGVTTPADNLSTTSVSYTNKADSFGVNANVVDTNKAATNFARNFNDATNQATFDITVGSDTATITVGTGATLAAKLAANPGYKITVDDLVTDIKEQLLNSDLKDNVSVSKTEDGKVRLFTEGADMTLESTNTDATDSGTLNAIFGDLKTDTDKGLYVTPEDNPGATAGAIKKIVMKSAKEAGSTSDVLPLDRDYAFTIKDTEGKEIATVKLDGPFEDTVDSNGKVTKTAMENVADAINKQLTAVEDDAAADFKAIVTKDADGTEKLSLYSKVRDFELADTDDVDSKSVWGYEALFGKGTAAGAEKNQLKEISTIGDVANSSTNLRDLEKFWDSEGNFMLKDPQTLTLTQGDGKQATVTLYEYDTLGSMAEKINNAIANDLGQAKYVTNGTDADGKTIDSATKFATFVDKASEDSDGNKTNTSESVEGTMLIRSVVPGSNGSISFSGNESLINALSLNTIQGAKESQYEVTIKDAHSGDTVVDAAKITGNKLVGALHPNVDVEFDAMAGVTASWDDEKKNFVYTDSKSATPAETYTTFLHLTDNTTVFQIGANEGEDMGINIGDMRSHALGLDEVNVTNRERAARSITVIDNAIDKVSMQRSKLGAYQNRLEHTINNLTTANENLTAAESRIRDTDMAKEMMNFSKLQIMLQAGNSMMAQANQLPQNVLSLVR